MPTLDDIDRSFGAALAHVGHARRMPATSPVFGGRARVFVDLWELERFADRDADADGADFSARRERLALMNLEQRVLPDIGSANVAIAPARGARGAQGVQAAHGAQSTQGEAAS